MQYKDGYEDELDRMRARHQMRKAGRSRARTQRRPEDTVFPGNTGDPAGKDPARNINRAAARRRSHGRRKKHPIIVALFVALAVFAGVLAFKRGGGEGYWTVAVFGVDSREGKTGKGALSDVEMLASINRKTGEIRLVSVFRDTYVKIDSDWNYDKINEAYFLGGYEQGVEALQDNLDLHIDDYATFNWKAVADAINVLGGVDVEITDREFAYINSFITETVQSTGVGSVHLEHSGMNHLDGVQAVAYARLRLMDTDFSRTERQRKILGLTMEKVKKADFKTLKTLVGTVYPQVSTSIGVEDILVLAKNARKYYIGQTSGFPFSHSEMKISKKSCVVATTLESNVTQLHAFLYDDTAYRPSGMVQEISAHIAKKSGLTEPGKDIESGKNVGAEGNNEGGQNAAPQTKETQAEQGGGQAGAPEAADPGQENGQETAAQESDTQEDGSEKSENENDAEDDADGSGDLEGNGADGDQTGGDGAGADNPGSSADSGSGSDAIETFPDSGSSIGPGHMTPGETAGPGSGRPAESQKPTEKPAVGPGNSGSGAGGSGSNIPGANAPGQSGNSGNGPAAGPGADGSGSSSSGHTALEGPSSSGQTGSAKPGQTAARPEPAGPGV